MKYRVLLSISLSMGCFAVEATSIYKCVNEIGRVEFSQAPCAKDAKKLTVTVPNIGTEGSTAAREMLKKVEDANRPREIDNEIKDLEKNIAKFEKAMDADIQRLKDQKKYASNNLAGATWEESISTEMSATVASYRAKIENARAQIKYLQEEKLRLNAQ